MEDPFSTDRELGSSEGRELGSSRGWRLGSPEGRKLGSSTVPKLVWALATMFVLSTLLAAQAPARGKRPQTPAERASERIRQLQREAEALVAQESQLLVELRKLEIERQIKVEEVTSIERQQKETAHKLEDAAARADALQLIAEADRPDIEARLVQLYKLGRAGYWRLLFDVDDVRSLGRVYRTAAAMTHLDRERIQAHQRTLEALARERTTLEVRSKELAALEAQATRARAALDRAVQSRTALVASIDQRRDLNAQWTSELQAAQQRLQTSIAQLDDTSLPFRPFKGALPWPARGPISSRFGRQPSSRFGTSIVRNGIEIDVAEAQLVRTVHEGVVAFADQFTGYGNLVIVEHGDGAFSLYGHLNSMQVQKGAQLSVQAPLGRSGRNPNGTPALYFELRVDGKPVDPLQWLQKGAP
jgi:septal ring factor EnvC (AmiA/AmiB activator)